MHPPGRAEIANQQKSRRIINSIADSLDHIKGAFGRDGWISREQSEMPEWRHAGAVGGSRLGSGRAADDGLSAVQLQSAGQTAIVGRFALFEGVFGLSSKDGASDRSGAQAGGSVGSFVT